MITDILGADESARNPILLNTFWFSIILNRSHFNTLSNSFQNETRQTATRNAGKVLVTDTEGTQDNKTTAINKQHNHSEGNSFACVYLDSVSLL